MYTSYTQTFWTKKELKLWKQPWKRKIQEREVPQHSCNIPKIGFNMSHGHKMGTKLRKYVYENVREKIRTLSCQNNV